MGIVDLPQTKYDHILAYKSSRQPREQDARLFGERENQPSYNFYAPQGATRLTPRAKTSKAVSDTEGL